MSVRFRRANGTEFKIWLTDLPQEYYYREPPTSLAVFNSPPPTVAMDSIIAFDPYRTLDGYPIYVERGAARKWIK